ncbi:hypothetical protein FKM82_006187 [Ascaphus truei]
MTSRCIPDSQCGRRQNYHSWNDHLASDFYHATYTTTTFGAPGIILCKQNRNELSKLWVTWRA